MMVIQPAKKRKIPNLKAQRRDRNDWPIIKVKKRLTATVMLCPADRISKGNISLGTVHPSGPHDHPKATTKRQITTTTKMEKVFESSLSLPNLRPKRIATTTCFFHEKLEGTPQESGCYCSYLTNNHLYSSTDK